MTPLLCDDPSSEIIYFPVVIFKTNEDHKEDDPVLYLTGGPASAKIDEKSIYRSWSDFLNSNFIKSRDLIVFDYRGIGQSEPVLVCKHLDKKLRRASSKFQFSRIYRSCKTNLISQGIDLKQYNANSIVNDLILLKDSMKISSWNLYGFSYGSLISLLLAEEDSESIRSMILISPYPPEFAIPFNRFHTTFLQLINKHFKKCKQDILCNQKYPNAEKDFVSVLNQLEKEPVKLSTQHGKLVRLHFDNADLISFIFNSLYTHKHHTFIPQVVSSINNGEMDGLIEDIETLDKARAYPNFLLAAEQTRA